MLVGWVSTKHTEISLIASDKTLTDLFIADKLERQAAHGLFRSVVTAIETAFEKPVSRSKLPANWYVMPITNRNIQRVKLASGAILLVNTVTQDKGSYLMPLWVVTQDPAATVGLGRHFVKANTVFVQTHLNLKSGVGGIFVIGVQVSIIISRFVWI